VSDFYYFMKKNRHPKLYKTIVVMTNGATFTKSWVFLKQKLVLDIDALKHKLWQQNAVKKIK